jgi:hypothetical protein
MFPYAARVAERDSKVLWPVVGAFVVAVVGVCLAVFAGDPPTSLRVYNSQHNSVGESVSRAIGTKPYVFVGYPLCVAHGSVTITGVAPHDPENIKVVDWAASTSSDYPAKGDADQGLAKHLPGFTHKDISHPCSKAQQFAISVERTGSVGVAHGFDVRSTSGNVLVPFTVKLCASACPEAQP